MKRTALCVLISDLHLDAVTAGVPRWPDVVACLGEVRDYIDQLAHEAQRSFVFFAGDLCDPGERSHIALRRFSRFKHQCEDELSAFVWGISGNHDVVEDGSGASTLFAFHDDDDLEHGSEFLLCHDREDRWNMISHDDGSALQVLEFAPRSHAYDPVAAVESWDGAGLIVGHLNLEGMTHGSETDDMPRGREVFWPMDAIRKKFPNALVVGGHYHAPQEKDGVHIIGAPGDFSFGDADVRKLPHSFSVVYEENGKLGIERIPFVHQRQVLTIRKLPDTIAELKLKPNAIVRVKIETATTSQVNDLVHELRDRVEQVVVTGQAIPEWKPIVDPDEIARREEVSAKEAAIQAALEYPAAEEAFRKATAELVEVLGGEAASQ